MNQETDVRAKRAVGAMAGLAAMVFPTLAWADASGADTAMTGAFGPLFLLSIAIERLWETFFTAFESSTVAFGWTMKQLGRPFGDARKTLTEAKTAYDDARRELLGSAGSGEVPAAVDSGLEMAERTLERVRERVVGLARDPVYVRLKRRIVLYGSPVLGLVAAWYGQITLFEIMGVRHMPHWLDIGLTGLIAGSGSEPMHGLVSSLGNLNRALCGVVERTRTPPGDNTAG